MRRLAIALLALAPGCAPAAPVEHDWRLSGEAAQGGLLFGVAPPGTRSLRLDGIPVRLAGDGRFVIGLGRDAGPRSRLSATRYDDDIVELDFGVTTRDWPTEAIPSLRVTPDAGDDFADPDMAARQAAYAARRSAERARIDAARAGASDAAGWSQAFAWPARGRISGVFGAQRVLGGTPASPHSGVDVAAPTGAPVTAPADGVVRLAGEGFSLEGGLVMLDHGMGLVSSFMHLSSIAVHEGQRVVRGDPLGAVGATGRASGPHLHWGLSWGAVRVDPARVAIGEP